MEENSGFKLNFITLFIISTVVIAIVVLLVMFGLNGGKTKDNKLQANVVKRVENEVKPNTRKFEETELSYRFLKMENDKSNMIYSPLSIKYALKMLNDGASGNTQKQIQNLIGNENVPKYSVVDKTLSLANSIFIRDSYSRYINEDYTKLLINDYNAEVKYDSFQDAKVVNNWIEKQTLGQIKDMLNDESVSNPECKMILVNALAIDMEWGDSFDAESTHGDTFYLEDGKEIQATMMNQKTDSEDISYYQDSDITMLSMNLDKYDDTQMEFVLIMPDDDLHDYIESFDIDNINRLSKELKSADNTKNGLDIRVPRFSYEYDLNLKSDLVELGVKDAFDQSLADFSKITNQEKLFVSDALHKANIDFSEKGVKAAAATVVYGNEAAAFVEELPIIININKPFMYIVRDKSNQEVWFVGAVYKPNLWENDKADYQYK